MGNPTWKQYNVSISGGGENNTYRSSVTYNKNENQNMFVGNNREEIMTNIRNVLNIGSNLTFTGDLTFNTSNTKLNGMSLNDYSSSHIYENIIDDSGNKLVQTRGLYQPFKESMEAQGYPYNWDYNLLQEHENKNNKIQTTMARIQTSLKYDITDHLFLQGSYQYEYTSNETSRLYNEETYFVRNLVNINTTLNSESNELEGPYPKGYIITKGDDYRKSYSGRIQLNFDKSFNNGFHKVNVIAGYEARKVKVNSTELTQYGYDPQALTFKNVPYGESYTPLLSFRSQPLQDPTSLFEDEDRFISYYGNAAYTYNNKYTFTSSVRLDDANLFGSSKEYRNIPLFSIGGKWNLTKEDFINDGVFSKLALSTTYGSNGNVDTNTSPF
ncbi:hypothetical protein [Polaribacter sp. Q13]|uniref:hypothetical protein n=1 Tax=Polaribacter sp. Q13 TaxID=2806551 RepID=UPI00193B4862|nr:hypothetical protein [Polaribacter sp. Q13]QVY65001.1 hypothetical protein JOP69_14785 [Polaribacter sp. Q13]